MNYPVAIYLVDLATGRSKELFFVTVVATGLRLFHAMSKQVPFLVRLSTAVAPQLTVA